MTSYGLYHHQPDLFSSGLDAQFFPAAAAAAAAAAAHVKDESNLQQHHHHHQQQQQQQQHYEHDRRTPQQQQQSSNGCSPNTVGGVGGNCPRNQMSLQQAAAFQADAAMLVEQLNSVPMTGFEPPSINSFSSHHSHHHHQAHQLMYTSPSYGNPQHHAVMAAAVAQHMPPPHPPPHSSHFTNVNCHAAAYQRPLAHSPSSAAAVAAAAAVSAANNHQHAIDCDPRELEAFAERFKQRRIKLGVTQADVGKALGNLKLPGVGSLSQSTICRFESLTLSHNNMIALKPVLAAWLDEAERQARENKQSQEIFSSAADAKRKRTSITAQEKRSLEAYFAVQPRPSGEKIAQIADKLGLKKNVVRVWFCNQRQKQKRMKFSNLPNHC